MTVTALILLVASVGLHAGWNLLGKKEHPSAAFFFVADILGSVVLLPVVVMYGSALLHFPARVWFLIFISGFFFTLYYASLAGAYRAGDMSVAYPLARSSPVIVVTFVTLVLGRGDQVTVRCIIGIVLVVGGCFLVPMKRFSDFRLRNYLNLMCLLALGAAVGTAGYSMIDDEALRILRGTAAMDVGITAMTMVFCFMETINCALWLGAFVLIWPGERGALRGVLRTRKARAALTGVAIYVTYILVLISMAYVRNVSYVVAFRQLSIPIGAALGVIILKEPRHVPKFVGTAVMLVGLILVGTG
jgi:drug/metabolite transporter (DMT)-like permease